MPGDQRPEDAVLELIASGTAQCKEAADACRQRGRSAALGAVPLLDAPRRHPVEELEKVLIVVVLDRQLSPRSTTCIFEDALVRAYCDGRFLQQQSHHIDAGDRACLFLCKARLPSITSGL